MVFRMTPETYQICPAPQPNCNMRMTTTEEATALPKTNLNTDALERIRTRGDKLIARCPLCAEDGHDRHGDHLAIIGDYVSCIKDPEHGFKVKKMIQAEQPAKSRVQLRSAPKRPTPQPRLRPTDEQIRIAHCYCADLAGDEKMIDRIARHRGWNPETIRGLALEADLGWTGRELAFCYAFGCKLRGRRPDGTRSFRWLFGGNHELWRGAWLSLRRTRRVWITEGETDAITLIDRGFDDVAKGSLVVALPGASTWRGEWAPKFVGSEVRLVPDRDEAGAQAADKIAADLARFGVNVGIYDWSGGIS